ncbi:uncharacterized protein LOC143022212 [Oratosquilla oratoria]|uniref:uncharacterized protein LOC143022212 n=1 Tax=Oratosquilla oratoria TaxID=337810 RepID=UPI003F768013
MAEQLRSQQQVYRQRRDISNEYNDDELIKLFRMNRAGIITALAADLLRDQLKSRTRKMNCSTMQLKMQMNYEEEEPGEAEIPPNLGRPAGRIGHPFRDDIANLHFSRPVAE